LGALLANGGRGREHTLSWVIHHTVGTSGWVSIQVVHVRGVLVHVAWMIVGRHKVRTLPSCSRLCVALRVVVCKASVGSMGIAHMLGLLHPALGVHEAVMEVEAGVDLAGAVLLIRESQDVHHVHVLW